MEQQEDNSLIQKESVVAKSPHVTWIIIITAIVIAVLVGGGMYVFQLQRVKNVEKKLNQVNDALTILATKVVVDTAMKTKVSTSSDTKKMEAVKTSSTAQYTKKLINTNSEYNTYVVVDSDGVAMHDEIKFGESFASNILLDTLGTANKVEVTTSTNPYDTSKVITYTVSYYDGLITGSYGTTITSTKYKINKGLNIGVSPEKVWEVLGPPAKIHEYKESKVVKYMYGSAGTATTFTFDGKKLIKIQYGGYRG